MSIQFEQIEKRYGDTAVVNDVSLQIATGEFFVLLGPSGSGKSTLLRAAAGLTDIDHGRIRFHGQDVTHVPARERGVGLVFQHYALFRHMSVGDNVEFALRVRGIKRAARAQRREELLRLVSLEGYADRMPGQLSGGQQQRVAVARALAHEPAVLLLDEPFGALDAQIRVELRDTIRDVQRRLGMTTILVTHDQEEAFSLGDRIGIMYHGRLLETGKPDRLYRYPATRFVANFLGAANLLLGQSTSDGVLLGKALVAGGFRSRASGPDDEVIAVVRPEDIELADGVEQLRSAPLGLGHVESLAFAGGLQRLRVQMLADSAVQSAVEGAVPGAPVTLEITRNSSEQSHWPLAPGRRVALGVRRTHVLPTPISSFRIHSDVREQAETLRRAPLLVELAHSMRARIIDASEPRGQDTAAQSARHGVTVLAGGPGAIGSVAPALARGSQRILCIPPKAGMPKRLVICTDLDAARPATLSLVASVMRHLPVEATFVNVQGAGASRGEVAGSFQKLLDARAELQETHGLDVRTDVQVGSLSEWLIALALNHDDVLIVLGLDGPPEEIEAALTQRFQPLFSGRCPILMSCSHTSVQSLSQINFPDNKRILGDHDDRP